MGVLLFIYIIGYILMGIIQPFGALIRLLGERRRDSAYAIGLKRYLMAVLLYFFILLVIGGDSMNSDSMFFYLMVLPWVFSAYYIIHVQVWKRKRKNITDYNEIQRLNTPHQDRLLLDSYPKKRLELKSNIFGTKHKAVQEKEALVRPLYTY